MRWVQWLAGGGLMVAAWLFVWGVLELVGGGDNAVPLTVLGTILALSFGVAFVAGRWALLSPVLVAGGVALVIGYLGIAGVGLFILPFALGVIIAGALEHRPSAG